MLYKELSEQHTAVMLREDQIAVQTVILLSRLVQCL
jgi:hypothetical protein